MHCMFRFSENTIRFSVNRSQVLCVLLLVAAAAQLPAQQRRRIAVMNLEVTADAKTGAARNGLQSDLGKDIADALIQRFVQDGKFTVIERSAIDKVIKEQNFSNSDRADADTAAKIGKIAGADAIIIGTVNAFDLERQTTQATTVFGHAIKPSTTLTLTIEATTRMIDTGTGEVVEAVPGKGISSGSANLLGQTPSAASLADDAKKKITADLAGGLEGVKSSGGGLHNPFSKSPPAGSSAPPPSSPSVAAAPTPAAASHAPLVADVSGNTLILTVGTSGGVKVGDVVDIVRPGRVIKDPQTGEVVKVIMTPVGKAKVTEADARSATAIFTGEGPVQVNDQVSIPGK
jgi:curli biogenesis system outer membrane secretion channel CsgG